MISHKDMIKNEAMRLGFMSVGVARAGFMDEDARRLEKWLKNGFNAGMGYMENHFDLRTNPGMLVPGAKSVITLMMNYYPAEQQNEDSPGIARYAWGVDYHYVIREKLNQLLAYIQNNIGAVDGRGFVDSAPVLERSWAVRSGLGWVAKNGNLISKQAGSFFFLATLICDLELEPDPPFVTDHCGTCTRCMDACPTGAIVAPTVIDANRCISYLTIELKDAVIPDAFAGKMDNWMFGCDTCQEVCPWNRFSQPHNESAFRPLPGIINLTTKEWEEMTENTFNTLYKNSPLKRTRWKGIQRNLKILKM